MIILISGDDNYSSQKRLLELKKIFKEKYGEINISLFEIENKPILDLSKIKGEINSIPFLGEKRLVIINGLLTNARLEDKEKMRQAIPEIPKSSVVIFYEPRAPKKNEKIFKDLLKLAKVEEFSKLSQVELCSWIIKEARLRDSEIEEGAAARLAFLAGQDLWRISNELDKLINFCFPRKIMVSDVELMVREKVEAKIFDFIDNLASRDARSSLLTLHKLLFLGEEKIYLLSMMAYGFRNLILVKYLEGKDKKVLGLHPFVLSKAISASQKFSFLELKKIYFEILKANIKIRESDYDPLLVLDLLIARICQRVITS